MRMKRKDASFLLVAKLFLKKAPAKVAAECALSAMSQILVVVNSVWLLECLTDKSYWPYPTYTDLLYSVK